MGGTASALSGGKFANGAQTAAYGYLFNELLVVGDENEDRYREELKRLENIPGIKETIERLENSGITIYIEHTNDESLKNKYVILTDGSRIIFLNLDVAYVNDKTPFYAVVAHELGHLYRDAILGLPPTELNLGEQYAVSYENIVRRHMNLPNRKNPGCIPGYKDC